MALTEDRIPSPPRPSDDLAKMTLVEHLSELRNRLIVSIIAVIAMTTVSWFLYPHLLDFMIRPYHQYFQHHLGRKDISQGQLVTSSPLEGFTTRLKISGYGGIALSSPVLLWELWRFITPGLHKNEKRYIVPFVSAAIVLFAGGVTTAIFVFPKALDWLINVSGPGVVPLFSPQKYLTLYVLMCLIFGAVFMYPLIVIFLELSGVVPSARWRKWRRPAIVIIALIAAVITPSSDPFSFMAMAIPMLIFYEGAILVGRVLGK
ncbi:MAG: twin-arginine translocase subunit TatC [Actinomycetota bacterium]|nr:twin-arginine translocase subunit TatC [Actinomycetota bacterium]